jgi:outer membrane protein TolC
LQTRAVYLAKQDAVSDANNFEDDVRTRYDKAKVPYVDLLRAQVSLAKARADAAGAQGADANAADALAREVGLTVNDLRATVAETPVIAEVMSDDQAIARAFAQRGELRSADRSVEAAKFDLAAAHRAVVPPITVAGGYVNGVDAGNVVGSPALSLSMQIPLSNIAGARIAAQEAAVRAALAKRESVKRALALEVGAAARTASAAIIARAETANSLEAARSYLNSATSQYDATLTGGMMVKDATDIYTQAVVDDIAAEYAEEQAQATLTVELSP